MAGAWPRDLRPDSLSEAAPLAPLAVAFALGLAAATRVRPHPVVLYLIGGQAVVATAWLLFRERPRAAALALCLTVGVLGFLRAAQPPLPVDHVASLALQRGQHHVALAHRAAEKIEQSRLHRSAIPVIVSRP